jgi:predicted nucleotidyltransferase
MLSVRPDYPLDSLVVAIMREVGRLMREMKLSYFVCGAIARDVLLRHVHGIEAGTATVDVDFAVAIENWAQFEGIKARLIETNRFEPAEKMAQRLYYRSEHDSKPYPLDIIPFGKVEHPPNSIAWPPDGNVVMSVIGYDEALASTVEIEVEKDFMVPVISLPGLALLKLFAWTDRGLQNPKDAFDLVTLLRNYHDAGNEDRLYSDELDLLDAAGFDLTTAGPQLLGKDVRRISKPETLDHALRILEDAKQIERLVMHMASRLRHADDTVQEAERLLERFKTGLKGS